MKFDIGDSFVFINSGYFTNKYHYKASASIHKVAQANDKYFTSYDNVKISDFAGTDEAFIYHQNNGKQFYGNNQAYHLIKDWEIIQQIIRESLIESESECRNKELEKIQYYLGLIDNAKNNINNILVGDTELLSREGLNKVKKHLKELELI